jgi:hypothetical protein
VLVITYSVLGCINYIPSTILDIANHLSDDQPWSGGRLRTAHVLLALVDVAVARANRIAGEARNIVDKVTMRFTLAHEELESAKF